jgi:Xylanase inhibitor N-terminal
MCLNQNLLFPPQFFCSLYYALVKLGTPNVTFFVALDTGSDLFWVPCDCTQCAALSSPSYGVVMLCLVHFRLCFLVCCLTYREASKVQNIMFTFYFMICSYISSLLTDVMCQCPPFLSDGNFANNF